MEFHFTISFIIRKTDSKKCHQVEKLELFYNGVENIKWYDAMENSLAVPQKIKHRFIMLYNFSCIKHYISTSVSYGMLTTKNLVSVHHHTNKPFYQFCSPLPSCNHSSVSVSLLLFGLVYSFILSLYVCVLYSRCEWNHTVFVFFHLNYFYYAYYTLKESDGLQSHKVTKSRT